MTQTRLTTQVEASGALVRAQLVVVDGPDAGRAVPLDERRVVGSAAGVDLQLSDDRVSARHLEVTPAGSHFLVVDQASTNGTWLEGARVTQAQVPVGAVLKAGKTFLRIVPQLRVLEVPPSTSRRFGELVAESLSMRELFAVLELAARSDVTVLVTGETGTGKELVARALHEHSARRTGPFVVVDCGALPETLLESELFGHVRGAFTGAHADRPGAFLRAQGGTLFLDELGVVSPAVQARLLRALEAKTVRPVGSDDERVVDVRVVAATPVDLSTRVAQGHFRSDLYYRLSVVSVEVPPLRARREDLAIITAELLRRRGFSAERIEGPNFDRLKVHSWPGNVRELRNVLERALALSAGATDFASLRIALMPDGASAQALSVRSDHPWKEAKESLLLAFEEKYLRDVHDRFDGNVSAGARFAQVDRKHWRELLQKHGLVMKADESP